MATEVLRPESSEVWISAPGRRYNHLFFSSTAVAMLATVFLGFARSYSLAGVFRAPLPSAILHLHGAALSCWVLLLVVQTSLVAACRVDIHRRLGVAGFLLGCLMVILGVLAATDSLVRNAGAPGPEAKAFYIVPLTDIRDAAVSCLSRATRFRRTQTIYIRRHDSAADCSDRALAAGVQPSQCVPGRSVVVRFFGRFDGLRLLVYEKTASSHAMGHGVSNFSATGALPGC